MKADRLSGLVVVLAGLGLAAASFATDVLPDQPTLSARFFPLLLSVVLVACGLILTLRPALASLTETAAPLFQPRVLVIAGAFLLYATTFRYVDFRVGTWAFVLLAQWALGGRKPWELLLVPLAVSATVYLVFRYGFLVILPTWI